MKFLIPLAALAFLSQTFQIQSASTISVAGPAQQCTQKNCPNQINKCVSDADCKLVLDYCTKQQCKGGDDKCLVGCIITSRNKLANDILKCSHDHGCLKPNMEERMRRGPKNSSFLDGVDPRQCMRDHCSAEMENCSPLKDPQCLEAFRTCQNKCKQDVKCMHDCINSSGEQNAVSLQKCGEDNHCFNAIEKQIQKQSVKINQQCLDEHCKNEQNACDQACQDQLKHCKDKCGTGATSVLCWESCVKGNKNAENIFDCAKKYHCY